MSSTDFDYVKGSEKPRDAGTVYRNSGTNDARPQLNVNVSAAYSYLSALTREQGKLPDELQTAQATLQRHIATLASDPERAENANPVPRDRPLLELASKMILRDSELQEQVAEAFTTRIHLVKTSEAVDELKSYVGTLPRIFQESNEPGRALMRYLCEVIVNYSTADNISPATARQLATQQIFAPDGDLTPEGSKILSRLLDATIEFIRENQPDVISSLGREGVQVVSPSDRKIAMANFIERAVASLPDDAIVSLSRDQDTDVTDDMSLEMARRVRGLIQRAAKIAKEGNLLPENEVTSVESLKREMASEALKNEAEINADNARNAARSQEVAGLSGRLSDETGALEARPVTVSGDTAAVTVPPSSDSAGDIVPRSAMPSSPSQGRDPGIFRDAVTQSLVQAIDSDVVPEDAEENIDLKKEFERYNREENNDSERGPRFKKPEEQSGEAKKITQILSSAAALAKGARLIGDDAGYAGELPIRNISRAGENFSDEDLPELPLSGDLKPGTTVTGVSIQNDDPGEQSIPADLAGISADEAYDPEVPVLSGNPAPAQSGDMADDESAEDAGPRAAYVPGGGSDRISGTGEDVPEEGQSRGPGNNQLRAVFDMLESALSEDEVPPAPPREAGIDGSEEQPSETGSRFTGSGISAAFTENDVSENNVQADPESVVLPISDTVPENPRTSSPIMRENPGTPGGAGAPTGQNDSVAAVLKAFSENINPESENQETAVGFDNGRAETSVMNDGRTETAGSEKSAPEFENGGDRERAVRNGTETVFRSPGSSLVGAESIVRSKTRDGYAQPSESEDSDRAGVRMPPLSEMMQEPGKNAAGISGKTDTEPDDDSGESGFEDEFRQIMADAERYRGDVPDTDDGARPRDRSAGMPSARQALEVLEKQINSGRTASEDDRMPLQERLSSRTSFASDSDDIGGMPPASDAGTGVPVRKMTAIEQAFAEQGLGDEPGDIPLRRDNPGYAEPENYGTSGDSDISPEFALTGDVTASGSGKAGDPDYRTATVAVTEPEKSGRKDGLIARMSRLFSRGGRREGVSGSSESGNVGKMELPANVKNISMENFIRSLSNISADGQVTPEIRQMAASIHDAMMNPLGDLKAVSEWLGFVRSPLTASGPRAQGMQQWALMLLSIRFRQMGKDIDRFVKSKAIRELIKGALAGDQGDAAWSHRALRETLVQVERLQELSRDQDAEGIPSYIPVPPSGDDSREGGIMISHRDLPDGEREWQLNFFFDLPALGPIQIRTGIRIPDIRVNVVAERFEALERVRETSDVLFRRLQECGFNPSPIGARLGTVYPPVSGSESSGYGGTDGLSVKI